MHIFGKTVPSGPSFKMVAKVLKVLAKILGVVAQISRVGMGLKVARDFKTVAWNFRFLRVVSGI